MTYAKAVVSACLLLSLCQCDKVMSALKPAKAPPGLFAYTLRLDMTPAAGARMKEKDYHLNVHAFYYGRAVVPKAANADELNRIQLGYELSPFPAGIRAMAMTGEGIDSRLFGQIEDKQPYVLITVHAVNRSNFENDMLTCNNYINQIAEARKTAAVVRCHLQDEAG
ncbi:hypothetical protein [Asticcacaulis benevestitus]|uniref:Uncharacterized protein n=1 Tax=Asticcacaulis benevestitus DSM 16100 = ATCC BAA-896 TaxID=1121022 RepID=V4RM50_9CAUL|nr:hypothetical protein [Asticcacaulis benevestitus]ESQ92353.1 hypothetical protein ABENE_08230 [Asticcacaulis benevestitus DSM 16100 = ATCC BAA-896]